MQDELSWLGEVPHSWVGQVTYEWVVVVTHEWVTSQPYFHQRRYTAVRAMVSRYIP